MKTVAKNGTKPVTRQKKTPIQKLFGCMKGKISYTSDKIFNLD